MNKTSWSGQIISVQPRIRLMRSFDERYHNYLGYVLRISGTCGDQQEEFRVAIGKAAQKKHQFHTGMEVSGMAVPVPDHQLETAEYYKASGFKIQKNTKVESKTTPPYKIIPPDLNTYQNRGHRRLSSRTFDTKCLTCIWGCRMPVEMTIDHWNPSRKRYRFETFCYGPKSCPFYKSGPTRKVPGRKGMSYTEEDWIDEDATSHRGPDE